LKTICVVVVRACIRVRMERCWDARPVAERAQSTSRRQRIRNSKNTLTADNAKGCFCYLHRYGVLVCQEHTTSIQNLDAHLRDAHGVPKRERTAIVEELSGSYSWIKKPDEAQLPLPMGRPIEELGKPLDGFQCSEVDCDYITINENVFRRHCKTEHGLRWIGDTSRLYAKVKVQTFFRTGGLQRYFIVNAPDEADNSEVLLSDDKKAEIEGLLSEWKETGLEHEQKMQVMDADAAKTDKTGWFNRTGWLQHLAKRNRVHLAHAIRLPKQNEPKLKRAARVVELLVERSVAGLSTLARETRRWLRSAQREEIDQRPMARLQNPESQARYAGYMVMFVCYVLRIIANEETRAASSGDDTYSRDSNTEEDDTSDDEASSSDSSRRRREPDLFKDARKLFPWQGRQKELARELWAALDGRDEDAQMQALLLVLASFIFHNTGDNPFSNGLIHFLAVLGIDGEMDRLRTAKSYSYMLAGVVYCVRAVAIEGLLPSEKRKEQGDADREEFLRLRKLYLSDGSYSPMSEMLSLLAYGKFVALNAGNSGNVYWSRDKTIFYLNGKPIVIGQFQQMARDIVSEAAEMLWQELLWAAEPAERFVVKLDKIVDDVTFTKRGISFVNRKENGLSGGLEWMLHRVMQTTASQQLRSSDSTWNVKQVKRYLRRVDHFLGLMLTGIHVTSGQPGRGSEVTTMRHRNGVLQDRNIFVVDGQLMTVVRYHKSQSQWDKPKVVPRFLPWRLGQVFAVYLAYLQPFQEYLRVQVLGGGFSDYVWADEHGPWGTDRLTRLLKRETAKRLGTALTTLDYRHTAIGIGRVVVGEEFGRGYQDEVGEIEEAEIDEEGESALELQSARTTKMGIGNYSVPADIIKHLSIRSIETFRPLSELWHRFLGLASSKQEEEKRVESSRRWLEKSGEKRKRGNYDAQEKRVVPLAPQPKRIERTYQGEEEVHKAMQQVLGQSEVSFKSFEQEQAMYAVIAGQTPLVVVLPTGGGKSLLFTVPACLDGAGVTIVVVPYRALIEDLVGRIQRCGIDCIEWKHGESNPATIVVVSADIAGDTTSNGNFLGYANILSSKGLLRRVVVDECHLIFTSSDWRPKLAMLKNLRLLACPIVLLTATLPPVREGEIATSMLIQCATYVRASTVRPNTRYFVSWCERGKIEETALAMGGRQQQLLRDRRQKGVVYCHSKKQCEDIAEALECAYYHAGVPDRAERVEQWLKDGGLIVATSALGTGVDFPGVVYILHVGMPWSMIDYAQESGRGGRAGERVDSVILVEQGEVERTMQGKSDDLDVQAMGMFLIGGGCRRGLMSSYLDGKRVECNDMESAGCDRCGEGTREWQDSQREMSIEWQQVQEVMEEICEGCAICWTLGEAGTDLWQKHKTMQCTAHSGITGIEVDGFRRGIRDRGGSHSCRRCWISQKYCATGESISNRCQWPNVVVPLARAVAEHEAGVQIIRQCGFRGELGGDWKGYAEWLGKRHWQRVWGEYFSNVMVVAIRVILFERKYNTVNL
jgi:superfamily II DNA helicase RecQ